ncbi:hypothetical protein A7982_13527 [Minicystis rosea]|nr:hypothetical protein A7982_13527 [Minicystis rosea]
MGKTKTGAAKTAKKTVAAPKKGTKAVKKASTAPRAKKPSAAKAASKTSAAKAASKTGAAKSTEKGAGTLRGRALAEVVIAHLRGPKSPIGEPRPLSAPQRARCEEAMGVALSPFMDALFSFDVGWLAREVDLFDGNDAVRVAPAIEVIRDHAGVFTEFYEPWCAARLTEKAAQLDAGSDSMRFLYLGAPDEHGEYPVLCIDHDDVPFLGVEHAGFDLWVAEMLGLAPKGAKRLAKEASERILGYEDGWEMGPEGDPDFDTLPELAPAPAPGTVKHEPLAPSVTPSKQRKLTVPQLEKALRENARAGRIERLRSVIDEARARDVKSKAFDDALVEACLGTQRACIEALLAAGAKPNARDPYGGALSRLITYGGDVELVRLLLDAGASPNSPGVNGETALYEAIERGDEAITRLLIERGADVNHRAANEITPLHEAVQEQANPRFVDILCGAGARTDAGKKQSPVLVWAAEQASIEHVRRLLAHGAPVNQRAAYLNQTALHAAFAYGRDDVAAVLIEAGADRALKDERGISFERIYGPDGSDARSVSIRYAPSAEMQTLRLAIEVAVLNPYQAQGHGLPGLDANTWVRLITTGGAGEAELAPEAGRAEVVHEVNRENLDEAGFHRLELVLRVASVSQSFVRARCAALLGGARMLTGAGAESIMRVVKLDVEGSHAGGTTLEGAALRASLAASAAPGIWPEPLPFTLAVGTGPRAEVRITPASAKHGPEALADRVRGYLETWAALLERLPLPGDAPRLLLMTAPLAIHEGIVHVPVFDVLARSMKEPLRLPWPAESAAAQLGQVMRTLHARVPLARVELVLPA